MKKTIHGLALLLVLAVPLGLSGQEEERVKESFSFKAGTDRPLEVVLDIDAGTVEVEKGTDAVSGQVDVDYLREDNHVKVKFDEKTNRLQVKVDRDNWTKMRHDGDNNDHCDDWLKIHVTLPFGVDQYFDARIKAGEVNMNVGGLRFR
ncbi:MAG TPA: hypothetical protein VGB38_07420, partial [bacterium]